MESCKNIDMDIDVALFTIMEICLINNECVNCPLHYFCYHHFKVDPYKWDIRSVPIFNVK